ncbi:MAG TPA: 50S ribosomal protein L3 [Spirochaetia bacterium]|nr:MAG: 50S ribosomal protein L3 [Spirochaetes bacterium GWB1_36_13]HCL56611.1 50S ribosomal protein L3 [Spirochaetia bacterium]
MPLGIIGKKIGMTQVYGENGNVLPVTAVLVGPCQVLEIKTSEKNGYSAVKLGYLEKTKNVNKPENGYFEAISKAADKKITPKKMLKEFRTENISLNIGDVINADMFQEGESVDVVATSKGKGFQGVIKRYHFAGGPAAHGSKFHRKPGSIGAHTFPAKVWKGQKMPGHMGCETVQIKNLKIVKIDNENSLILVKGAIPGPAKGIVYLYKKEK